MSTTAKNDTAAPAAPPAEGGTEGDDVWSYHYEAPILATRPTEPGGAREETAAEELLRVIEFALAIDDHYEMRGFLNDWSFGDTSEWPEFADGASAPDEETFAASTASSDTRGAE